MYLLDGAWPPVSWDSSYLEEWDQLADAETAHTHTYTINSIGIIRIKFVNAALTI